MKMEADPFVVFIWIAVAAFIIYKAIKGEA